MRRNVAASVLGLACVFVVLLTILSAGAQADKPEQQQEGIETLTRGPMHEAYATPQALDPKPSPIVPKQPPEPVPEMPPDQKPEGSHVVWISGYWAWDDEPAEFVWVSGFWRDVPPGKRWVPGHWAQISGGWQWSSGLWVDEQQTAMNYVPPPPPTLETGPSTAAPAVDQFYTPGSWVYVERQYRWRPGFWLAYRPAWVYVPAHFVWTPAGCVFVEGLWDYELTRRGLLFCPVRLVANVWLRPGWRLLPRYIVAPEVIVGALFVRLDFHRYCFGDYFAASFLKHGFIPWVDYRLHRNIPEPLFNQYAWTKRADLSWERDLRKLYEDRRAGLVPRPPHTIAQQQQFLRDLGEHKAIKVGNKTFAVADVKIAERNLTMVSTLAKVEKRGVALKTLTPAAHAEVLKTIEHHADLRQERSATTAKILKENPPLRPTDPHAVVKLPSVPQHLVTPKTVLIPPAPSPPAHLEKVIPKYTPPVPPRADTKPLHHGSLRLPRQLAQDRLVTIGGLLCASSHTASRSDGRTTTSPLPGVHSGKTFPSVKG
jgi:hypothetical protein